MGDTRKFLVLGLIKSKNNGKNYAVGRMWSEEHKKWNQTKNSDGSYGDRLIEVPDAFYNKLLKTYETGSVIIADAYIKGHNDFDYPVWALKE